MHASYKRRASADVEPDIDSYQRARKALKSTFSRDKINSIWLDDSSDLKSFCVCKVKARTRDFSNKYVNSTNHRVFFTRTLLRYIYITLYSGLSNSRFNYTCVYVNVLFKKTIQTSVINTHYTTHEKSAG